MDRHLNKRNKEKGRKQNLIKPSRIENYNSMINELKEYIVTVDFFDTGIDWKAIKQIIAIHEKNDRELIN
jgi:hypothetical protein